MISALSRKPGNTVELQITIAWGQIQGIYAKIVDELIKEIELPGFRKGKAPRDMAVKHIQSTKVYEEVLKQIVPDVYAGAVKENNLHPIISPKVEVIEADEAKDWKLRIVTCEQPVIKLGDYKAAISELKNSRQTKIWVPGQEKKDEKEAAPTLSEVLGAISKSVTVELSELIIEQEVNRLLSNLINETQKLGMTIDQYLTAQGKTQEQLREQYQQQARETLKLEFALEEIAELEKIAVEPAEIEKVITKAKTPEEKKNLESQKYYIASLLRRQKTLNQLMLTPPGNAS